MTATPESIRAARAATNGAIPCGSARMHAFPTSQIRAKLVKRDGKQFYEVEGYASVFHRDYEMWDMFGPYEESVDPAAFDKTLSNEPDVAFLVNHKGVTMARTANNTLELYKDSTGLGAHAFLNAERQDVKDLASAIDDKLVDEMSFAFMLNDGHWNDDFDRFTILEADINRGDVSAVNYGANPYTSLAARAGEWLRESEHVPAVVARAAISRLAKRSDVLRGALQATRDSDDSPGALVAALDATLDQCCALIQGADLTALPPDVAQAIVLITAAETVADDLMEMLGIYDPDDAGENAATLPDARTGEPEKTRTAEGSKKTVRSVSFTQSRLSGI